jgi:hypothetical protein
MSAQQPATPREMRWIGAGAAAVGLYFMLIGFGLLPVPGGPRNLHSPLWIVMLAGLVFFLGGVAVLIQVLGRANATGDLPTDAPLWIRVAQYLIGVTIFASFAMVGSWVALAGDPRQFSSNVPFVGVSAGVSIARVAFGIGALICWFGTLAYAISGARKLIGRRRQA